MRHRVKTIIIIIIIIIIMKNKMIVYKLYRIEKLMAKS